MARIHYWQYIVDDQGRPLQDVDVRLYLSDNPTQQADIFTHHALGAPTNTSTANMKTNSDGFFEFWVGDEFENVGGYVSTQKFKLVWQRAGIQIGSISNIDIFPPIFKVDETDNSSSTVTDKNKTISNGLAYKWDTHVDSGVAALPHDINPVDTNKTDSVYNKLVSNSLINYILSAIASAGTLSIAATGAVERNFTVTSWTASAGAYYTVLSHFIGRQYPVLQVSHASDVAGGLANFRYDPLKVKSLNINQIELWVSEDKHAEVTIIG